MTTSLATTLRTERLVLRPPRPSDVAAILAALRRNEPHLRPFSPQAPEGRRATLASVARDVTSLRRAWRRDESYTFFLFPRGGDPEASGALGRITLGRVLRGAFQNSFLGYWIDARHQGTGLMTEAVRACVDFAFSAIDLHRVQAGVMPHNAGSIRVLEKLGFRREGLAERYLQIAGIWEDHVLYALTREEWRGPPSRR